MSRVWNRVHRQFARWPGCGAMLDTCSFLSNCFPDSKLTGDLEHRGGAGHFYNKLLLTLGGHMIQHAQRLIDRLALEKHPEGGYYRETYRSEESMPAKNLPERFVCGVRSFSTAIYFLLADEDYSALHRIKSDEVWHFYAGGALMIHELDQSGRYTRHRLGGDTGEDVAFQAVVRAGSWFGATLEKPDTFALVGCTVAPGFDFRDFKMADRAELLRLYPGHGEIIERLTR